MLEGALPIHAKAYNQYRMPIVSGGGFDIYPFLRERAWTLHPAEDPKNRSAQAYAQKKIRRIQADFKE